MIHISHFMPLNFNLAITCEPCYMGVQVNVCSSPGVQANNKTAEDKAKKKAAAERKGEQKKRSEASPSHNRNCNRNHNLYF